MKKILFLISLLASTMAFASGEANLDKAPANPQDKQSLQRGAKTFVTYCMACHSAQAMRYNRLLDIGFTTQQIKDDLVQNGAKVGDTMVGAMAKADAVAAFGVAPPDLSVIARFRGVDWLYTYLRSFYRDETRPTGWNNVVFDKVAMPHILTALQGEQVLHVEKNGEHETRKLVLDKPGTLSPAEYDSLVADLVNYLDFMGEPAKEKRLQLGVYVLIFLAFFFVLAVALKREFWKDIH
jgi:ubiquinol-cytochrome c reductase cytochrome c1 subunit